ncbi:hypothetical protein GCM10028787_32250 [Brachybacterium horti]
MSTPTRPTVLDYLLRAGDAFIAALELYGPAATAANEIRAQRLAAYADRCALLAARTAGRDTALLEHAVEVRDMASRTQILLDAIHRTRTTQAPRRAA